MKTESMKETILYLNNYLSDITKEYNLVNSSMKEIEQNGYEYLAFHNNDPIHNIADILIKNGYTGFLKTAMTHSEYCSLIKGKPNSLLLKVLGKSVNKTMEQIKMKDNRVLDAESYCLLMQCLCTSKNNLVYLDSSNKRLSRNKRYNISKTNYVEKLIKDPIETFLSITNAYLIKNTKRIEKLTEIRNLLIKIDDLNIEFDKNDFIGYCNELFSKISDLGFEDKRLTSLKISLKNKIKSFEEDEKKKEVKNDIKTQFIKFGTKEERMKVYEKNKKQEQLKALKGNLSSDSKLWVEILLSQLQEIDISCFENDPSTYVPLDEENIDDILDVVMLELSFNKENDRLVKILNTVKKR